MSPSSFDDLDRRERRQVVLHSALRIGVSTVLLMLVYWFTPVAGKSGVRALLELIAGFIVFGVLLAWQVHRILTADHPELRAAEALAIAVPVVLIVFAFAYLSLSKANASNFSEPLDRVGALYFTVTVISTVGFGDIVAKTDATRLLVIFQILVDIGLLVGIVRAVAFAARVGVQRRHGPPRSEPSEEER